MQQKILNGKILATKILDDITQQINGHIASGKRRPTLAVVLIGSDPASQIYVNNKKHACNKVGIKSIEILKPSTITQDELLELVLQLNTNSEVDGILVQLPLPKHLDSKLIIDNILPSKDVDGFSRYNMGSLALKDPLISPCTPHGIMHMLDSINFEYAGATATIIGASNIVGRPMALELLNRGATVTICNSKTKNLAKFTSDADLIVVAIGKPRFLKADWVRTNSVIIDVGINRLPDGNLCGDADFDNLIDKVAYITPVPSGVGPMTIAMLMQNTLKCYTKYTSNLK